GVLVGPDLLLTASHVVGPEDNPDCWQRVVAHFDYVNRPGVSPHETGVRVSVAGPVDCSPPSPRESAGSPLAWEVSDDYLDYALLRLAGSVPEPTDSVTGAAPRGYYTMEARGYDFRRAGMLHISQHPLGMSQKVCSFSGATVRINNAGTRIRYRGANTDLGSSGSPVISSQGRLIAIHHYSAGAENQGVPISAIVRSLRRLPDAELLLSVYSPPQANKQEIML